MGNKSKLRMSCYPQTQSPSPQSSPLSPNHPYSGSGVRRRRRKLVSTSKHKCWCRPMRPLGAHHLRRHLLSWSVVQVQGQHLRASLNCAPWLPHSTHLSPGPAPVRRLEQQEEMLIFGEHLRFFGFFICLFLKSCHTYLTL